MRSFFRRLGWIGQRVSKEAELEEEIRFHLEEEADEHEAHGLPSDEARRVARKELGNVARVKEDTRAMWTWTFLEQLVQDVRYGVRMMAVHKSFTALAVLSLALGIGATTAIFSFMDSILLRPLPVPKPESLVTLSWRTPRRQLHGTNRHDDSFEDPNGGFVGGFFSWAAFNLFRKDNSVFSSVFGYQGAGTLNVIYQGQAELAATEYVSGNYFSGLEIPPAAGRVMAPDDDRAGAPAVAVISFALSQKRFGGPEKAVGQTITINKTPFTVIGVAPSEFFGADPDQPPDIYVPMHANLLLAAEDQYFPPAETYVKPDYDWVVVMARLRPGVSAAQAQAVLSGPFFQLKRAGEPKLRWEDVPRLLVRETAGGLDGLQRTYAKPLYILLAMVGLILAIACTNIANLLLARAAARKREIAVRLSIGAGRMRIVRQLLTESVLMAAMGGMLGVGFAMWGIRALTVLLANGRENFTLRAELNWHVLAAVAALTLLTGVLFGLAPALQSTGVDMMPALKESRIGEKRWHRFRGLSTSRVLMVVQIAFTLLILVAAGLFARTLSNLQSIQLGFHSENVLTVQLNALQVRQNETEAIAFYRSLRERFAGIPGVIAASLANHALIGSGTSGMGVTVSGGESGSSLILSVGPGFLTTMRIPLLAGREIDERDRQGSPLVAMVNEAFARSYLGGKSPLGLHLSLTRVCMKCEIQVVGLSANSLYGNLKSNPEPTVYLAYAQDVWPVTGMVYELRTAGNPLRYAGAVRDTVRRSDARIPISEMKTQSAWIEQAIGREIMFARLCGVFALLALTIACVGLYGSTSYNVARRTGEIGIRMALGAQRGRVVWMVLGEVVALAAIALAIGLPAAFTASKLIESFLYGMKPNDPLTVALSVATLVGAAILAGYLPARNASRIDPMLAVRHE